MIFHESRDNGWVALRRNLVPHVEDGRMTGFDWMVFTMLLVLADSDNGEVVTCCSAIRKVFHFGKELDDRAMRRILDRLDESGYIHRDITPGKRGLYTIRINKYAITTGVDAGKQAKIPPKIRRESGSEMPLRTPRRAPEDGVMTPCRSSSESTGSSDQESGLCPEDAVMTPCRALETGPELPTIQQRDLRGRKRREKETVVVVVAPTTEGDGHIVPSISSADGEVHQGTDLSGDLVETGAGQTGNTDEDVDPVIQVGDTVLPATLESQYMDTDEPTDLDGGTLDSDYEDTIPLQSAGERESAAPERRAAAPACRPADSLAAPFERPVDSHPVGLLVEAHELAKFFFELIGSPVQFKNRGKDWVKIALKMLGRNSLEDLKGAAQYGLSHKKFWQPKLMQFDRDPFAYLQRCLGSDDTNSLLAQYGGVKNARAFNQQQQKSEAHHGKRTTIGKSGAPTRADKAREAAEQAKRDFLARQ